jgi:long-chain acyl-CoA synthetase
MTISNQDNESHPTEGEIENFRKKNLINRLGQLAISDSGFGSRLALVDSFGKSVSYSELIDLTSSKLLSELTRSDRLYLFLFSRDIDSTVTYLSLLRTEATFIVLSPDISIDAIESLILAYEPDAIIGPDKDIQRLGFSSNTTWGSISLAILKVHQGSWQPGTPQILMSTSGSTGSPKQVRLSMGHLSSNADDISSTLGISSEHVALSVLSFSYSYGLSVLNSHLWMGATTVCSDLSPVSPGFIELIEKTGVTSLVGVPFTYDLYDRLQIFDRVPKSVSYFTQAGGALPREKVANVSRKLRAKGVSFHPMYGQTEATARISIMPSELSLEFPNSVGHVLPSGKMSIGTANHPSELTYFGPNTMLGYSLDRQDLLRDDENQGVLETGDLAVIDSQGLIFIEGRIKRIAKINGVRINLQEIEKMLDLEAQVAVYEEENRLVIFTELESPEFERIRISLNKFGIQNRDFTIRHIKFIPRLSSGKINYEELKRI